MTAFSEDQRSAFETLEAASRQTGMRVFVVGGVVRDLFSAHGVQNQDIDFLIEGNAIEFCQSLARDVGGTVKKFEDFITAKIVGPGKFPSIRELDFASSRTETYAIPGALPTVALATVEEDLKRRDFTVNAMALPIGALRAAAATAGKDLVATLKPAVIDHFQGLKDLANKKIEVLHDASFLDDPSRIFRAARYAVKIDGQPSSHTRALLERAIEQGALKTISEQRKINELRKICDESTCVSVVEFLRDWNILSHIEVFSGLPSDDLVAVLGNMTAPEFNAAKIDRVNTLLVVAGILSPQASGTSAFSKIGVAQKRIQEFSLAREWLSASALPDRAALTRASDAVLVAVALLSSNPAWNEVLSKRGLRVGS